MITLTKEQLLASAHARIEFAEMMLAGELEPLKERTWSIEMELARIALASLEAEPVAWDYEWASCITCEGPQNFKRIIEHEAPPEWAIHEGQARNLTPLYAAPPVPASVSDESAVELLATDLMKRIDKITGERHSIATLSSLRVSIVEACRASMLQGADVNTEKPLTIELPDISSKAFWSGTGKNETYHPETYRRQVKEAIERSCNIAHVDVEVK